MYFITTLLLLIIKTLFCTAKIILKWAIKNKHDAESRVKKTLYKIIRTVVISSFSVHKKNEMPNTNWLWCNTNTLKWIIFFEKLVVEQFSLTNCVREMGFLRILVFWNGFRWIFLPLPWFSGIFLQCVFCKHVEPRWIKNLVDFCSFFPVTTQVLAQQCWATETSGRVQKFTNPVDGIKQTLFLVESSFFGWIEPQTFRTVWFFKFFSRVLSFLNTHVVYSRAENMTGEVGQGWKNAILRLWRW